MHCSTSSEKRGKVKVVARVVVVFLRFDLADSSLESDRLRAGLLGDELLSALNWSERSAKISWVVGSSRQL